MPTLAVGMFSRVFSYPRQAWTWHPCFFNRLLSRHQSKMVDCPFGFVANAWVLVCEQYRNCRQCIDGAAALQPQRAGRVAACQRVGIT